MAKLSSNRILQKQIMVTHEVRNNDTACMIQVKIFHNHGIHSVTVIWCMHSVLLISYIGSMSQTTLNDHNPWLKSDCYIVERFYLHVLTFWYIYWCFMVYNNLLMDAQLLDTKPLDLHQNYILNKMGINIL